MAIKKILITVKTYPTLSKRYDELVCTAGVLEDGTLIRIYPIPFRKLDYIKQYKKDLYFFLGTTQQYHHRSRNPFIIIGTFHPKREEQNLFDK